MHEIACGKRRMRCRFGCERDEQDERHNGRDAEIKFASSLITATLTETIAITHAIKRIRLAANESVSQQIKRLSQLRPRLRTSQSGINLARNCGRSNCIVLNRHQRLRCLVNVASSALLPISGAAFFRRRIVSAFDTFSEFMNFCMQFAVANHSAPHRFDFIACGIRFSLRPVVYLRVRLQAHCHSGSRSFDFRRIEASIGNRLDEKHAAVAVPSINIHLEF